MRSRPACCVVDNKHNTNHAPLIDASVQAHAPGRWMAKQIAPGGYDWLNAAAAAGAPVWAYWYPADLGSLSTFWANLAPTIAAGVPIVYGFGDFSAATILQADTTTFMTEVVNRGITSWAHIIDNTTQKATADSEATTAGHAFDGYMVSGFSAVAPDGRPPQKRCQRDSCRPIKKKKKNKFGR